MTNANSLQGHTGCLKEGVPEWEGHTGCLKKGVPGWERN